jgi:ABC-2 type transport system permease protein
MLDGVVALGWFLLGYGIYAIAFASMGALVERQEDLSAAVGPFSAALVLSYFASIQASAAPNSALARFTSMFPLSAPVVMPVRSAEGTVPAWEIAVAVGSCVVCFLLFVRVGAMIYRRALLRGGRRLTVREVLARA